MKFKMLLNQELTFACWESATRGFVHRPFFHVSGEMLCPTHPPSSPVTQGWQKRHVTQMTYLSSLPPNPPPHFIPSLVSLAWQKLRVSCLFPTMSLWDNKGYICSLPSHAIMNQWIFVIIELLIWINYVMRSLKTKDQLAAFNWTGAHSPCSSHSNWCG